MIEVAIIWLVVLLGCSLFSYWMGYRTAKPHYFRQLAQQYHDLHLTNIRLAETPSHRAKKDGFREGYAQGVQDAYVALRQLID